MSVTNKSFDELICTDFLFIKYGKWTDHFYDMYTYL